LVALARELGIVRPARVHFKSELGSEVCESETLLRATDQMRSCNHVNVAIKVDYRKGKRGRLTAKVASVEQKLGRKLKSV
jgi:hypothetical protein